MCSRRHAIISNCGNEWSFHVQLPIVHNITDHTTVPDTISIECVRIAISEYYRLPIFECATNSNSCQYSTTLTTFNVSHTISPTCKPASDVRNINAKHTSISIFHRSLCCTDTNEWHITEWAGTNACHAIYNASEPYTHIVKSTISGNN